MASHRSDRRRWWRRDRMSTEVDWAVAASTPTLETDEIIVCKSEPVYVPRKHPWRQVACLVCGQADQRVPMRAHLIIGAAVQSASEYTIGSSGWLICAWHPEIDGRELWRMAHFRDRPGCPCHTRSAADAASYPYHDRSTEWLS